MHLLTALVFAVALWLTLGTAMRTALHVKTERTQDTGPWAALAALAWGLFYWLTT